MTNYNLEEFKTWLNENESRKEKISKEVQHVAGRHRGKKYLDCFFDKSEEDESFWEKATTRTKIFQLNSSLKQEQDEAMRELLAEWKAEIDAPARVKELEKQLAEQQARIQELETEANTHLEALQTSQTWHESQKKQITEQKDNEIKHIKQTLSEKSLQLTNTLKSLSDLQSENKTLKQTNQDQKQRILALEADKSDLLKTLNQQKEKHQTHLNKQKQQLTKQITLIKEALNK